MLVGLRIFTSSPMPAKKTPWCVSGLTAPVRYIRPFRLHIVMRWSPELKSCQTWISQKGDCHRTVKLSLRSMVEKILNCGSPPSPPKAGWKMWSCVYWRPVSHCPWPKWGFLSATTKISSLPCPIHMDSFSFVVPQVQVKPLPCIRHWLISTRRKPKFGRPKTLWKLRKKVCDRFKLNRKSVSISLRPCVHSCGRILMSLWLVKCVTRRRPISVSRPPLQAILYSLPCIRTVRRKVSHVYLIWAWTPLILPTPFYASWPSDWCARFALTARRNTIHPKKSTPNSSGNMGRRILKEMGIRSIPRTCPYTSPPVAICATIQAIAAEWGCTNCLPEPMP